MMVSPWFWGKIDPNKWFKKAYNPLKNVQGVILGYNGSRNHIKFPKQFPSKITKNWKKHDG